jgi:superfamily II DNA or RNA helicase
VSIINSIANYSKRNEFIVKLIEKNVRKHREIMVLSERVSQLNELYTVLSKTMKVSRNYSKYREYSDSNNSVVLASYSMASEGLNITDLDTLILATPIASKTKLIQSVGRIQRSETKSKIVYDIIDPVMEYQYYKRKRIYKTFESKIDEIVEIQ